MNGRPDAERSRVRAGRPWWWLVVAAIAVLVAVLLVRGGGDGTGVPDTVPETPSLEPADPGAAAAGSITIGGEPAEPLLDGRDLTGQLGEEVRATLVPVELAVVEGIFWAGERDRALLAVEPADAETPLGEGDRVTFRGTLQRLDDDVRLAIVGAYDGRAETQGAYVAVEDLALEEP